LLRIGPSDRDFDPFKHIFRGCVYGKNPVGKRELIIYAYKEEINHR
jgi:hypothetical protein